jgi:hypothetical protein
VYIPISLIILTGIIYICWKNRKALPLAEATPPVPEVVNSLKQASGKEKVHIRVPGITV